MNVNEHAMQMVNKLAFKNGRMRFLIGEAITYMSHAETFIESREKMRPEGVRQWGELIDRLREVIADSEPCNGGWIGPPDASLRQWSCRCGATHPTNCITGNAKA